MGDNMKYVFIIMFLSFTMIMTSISIADPITNPDDYNPGKINDVDIKPIATKGGIILDFITTIGIVQAVIVLIILGIKYMIGSVEEKAEYKKSMIPYLIGIVMVGSISAIIKVLAKNIGGLTF